MCLKHRTAQMLQNRSTGAQMMPLYSIEYILWQLSIEGIPSAALRFLLLAVTVFVRFGGAKNSAQ